MTALRPWWKYKYLVWHRIMPAVAPWMAATDTLQAQVAACRRAMFFQGLNAIQGAGRRETAR